MYAITEVILKMFDIKKLKTTCNYPNCKKKPEKEIFIYEYRIKRSIGIATLYLCKEHVNIAKELIKKVRKVKPTMIIEKQERNIKT